MIELYPEVKLVHVLAVLVSGGLFAVRGALVLADVQAANHAVLRFASYAVDTVLLTAALMLATMLHQKYPFIHGWLTVKLLLLVVYIVLGTLALKRAKTRRGRLLAYVAALATYAAIVGVARAHHPLGWLHALVG